MFDNNQQTFVPIYYHLTGGAYQTWCGTRANFFTLQFTPYLWLDGSYDAGFTYDQWINDLAIQELAPTDVTIGVNAFRGGLGLDVRATICVEPGGVGKDMRIYVVQVLDHWGSDTSWYYRNAFRQVVIEDVTVAAGACVDLHASMSVKDGDVAQAADIGVVVWAQEPATSGPAETYQAAFVMDPPGISTDGFENGDLSGWN